MTRTGKFPGQWLTLLIGALVIAMVPLFIKNNYYLGVLVFVAINTILAVGLNLLMGYAGQISLGHAAFFGIGAYASAVLTTQYHCSPWLAVLAGMLITGIIALAIGIPCLRLKGHYLAMATLGFGWIVFILFKNWEPLKGTSGIESIPKLAIGSLVFDNDVKHFYLTWAVALFLLILSSNIVCSRVGRALRALHTSERAAAALGVNVSWYKIQIYVISAIYASVAGSLYAHTVNFISPAPFDFYASVQFVVMVVIGGMASIYGAPVGAITITLMVEGLRSLGQSIPFFSEFDVIAHGLILILVMIFLPSGVFCSIQNALAARRKRRIAAAVKPAPAVKEVV